MAKYNLRMARALLLLLFMVSLLPLMAQQRVRSAYIQKYKDIAVEQMKRYGIPASITLAQACLESANGTSPLATKANNHFGIKCHNWSGKSYKHDDDRKGECFRSYSNPEESFTDHSLFLVERARYRSLFSLNREDYKAWAHGLKAAGYATNPQYAQLLIKIIEENNLQRYDRLAGGKSAAYGGKSEKAKRLAAQLGELQMQLTELEGRISESVREANRLQSGKEFRRLSKELKSLQKSKKRLEKSIKKCERKLKRAK